MSNARTTATEPVLTLQGIARSFEQGGRRLEVLKNVNLAIIPGELVALLGPSGSGKSTLLHIAGLLDSADGGELHIAGENCSDMKDEQRTRMRRMKVGFVYQFHHLLPEFTAVENVAMPLRIQGLRRRDAEARARALLDALGLQERLTHRPPQLSGGEQQRVAIARAMVNNPATILADEPTGNLDAATAGHVFDMLVRQFKESGIGALIATHNEELAAAMDRTVRLQDGHLVDVHF